MTKTFYLSVEQDGKKYVLITKDGKKYKCPEMETKSMDAVRHILKNNDRCLRIKVEDSVYTAGTSHIDKWGDDDKIDNYLEPFKTVDIPKDIDPEQAKAIDFIHNESTTLLPKDLKLPELKWKYLMRSVMRGRNIMMTGPAGCGKTKAVQSVATVFPERNYFYFDLGNTDDPKSLLIGNTRFEKDKGTYFSESAFIKAITTPFAIILLDELSRAHPSAMNILMPILDYTQRYVRLDEADGSPTISVAEGVCFIATANIGAEYTSTRVIDRALLDRFTIIEMDMLDVKQEVELLSMLYPKLENKKITAIAEIAVATRDEIKAEAAKISTIISTRATVEIASLLNDGFKLQEAAEVAIYPFFDESGGIDSARTFIQQLVQKYITVDEEDIFNIGVDGEAVMEDEVEDDGSIDTRKPF